MERLYASKGKSNSFGQLKADPMWAKEALNKSYKLIDLRKEGEYIVESSFKIKFDFEKNAIYAEIPKTKGDVLNILHSIGLYYDLLVPATINEGYVKNLKVYDKNGNLQFNKFPKISYKTFNNTDYELVLDTPVRIGYSKKKDLEKITVKDDPLVTNINPFETDPYYNWAEFNQGTDYIFVNSKTKNLDSLIHSYINHCINKIGFVSSININDVKNPKISEILGKMPSKYIFNLWDEFVNLFTKYVKEKKSTFEQVSKFYKNENLGNYYISEGKLFLPHLDLRCLPSGEVLKFGRNLRENEEFVKKTMSNWISESLYEDDTSSVKGKFFRRKVLKITDNYQFRNPFFIEQIKTKLQKETSFKKEAIIDYHNNKSYLIVPTHIFFQKIKQSKDMLRRIGDLNIAITSNEANTIYFDTRRSDFTFNGFPRKLRNNYLRNIKPGTEAETRYNNKSSNPAVKFANLEKLLKK